MEQRLLLSLFFAFIFKQILLWFLIFYSVLVLFRTSFYFWLNRPRKRKEIYYKLYASDEKTPQRIDIFLRKRLVQITSWIWDVYICFFFTPYPLIPIEGVCAEGLLRYTGRFWGVMVALVLFIFDRNITSYHLRHRLSRKERVQHKPAGTS